MGRKILFLFIYLFYLLSCSMLITFYVYKSLWKMCITIAYTALLIFPECNILSYVLFEIFYSDKIYFSIIFPIFLKTFFVLFILSFILEKIVKTFLKSLSQRNVVDISFYAWHFLLGSFFQRTGFTYFYTNEKTEFNFVYEVVSKYIFIKAFSNHLFDIQDFDLDTEKIYSIFCKTRIFWNRF